jgi:phosphoglucomutase
MNKSYSHIYNEWCKYATEDIEVQEELQAMSGDARWMEDAFYRNLAFGTGGLRGVIGAGSNRMNIYTVAKASQGLANYVCKQFAAKKRRIAISYDSRVKSDVFARVAAEVFAANGIQVELYRQLMPTPCLSYAVRSLHCAAGIMVTASHNPAKYNGYKVYGADGCQITTEAAAEILQEIEAVDIFRDVKRSDFDRAMDQGQIAYISEEVYDAFVREVLGQSMLTSEDVIDKNVAIVYTPLNGTGLKPVTRTLQQAGYTNITVVAEQEAPDGNFPTCPYPNPEMKEAMALGVEYAKRVEADLVLATDPDCDRVGIAVKSGQGTYELLTGNQVGCLLLDYICARRRANGSMPTHPKMVKTIVTTDLGEQIASSYDVETINVLTGFKFIGEQIGQMEQAGHEDAYIFGFEESYGYLSGTYVRDKDAVDGAFLICEMFAYYKSKGIRLQDKLQELYHRFGYCSNTLYSFEFEGSAGLAHMQEIMKQMREGITEIGGLTVQKTEDYQNGLNGLPKSDVLKFYLEEHCSVVVRPSGTEPKIKVYISVSAPDEASAVDRERLVAEDMKRRM